MASEPSGRNPVTVTITSLVLVIACVLLARWQLGRVDRPVDGYSAEPAAVALQSLVAAGSPVPAAAVARQVTASGRYLPGGQVVVPGHQLDGHPVSWVVTPLVLADGSRVLVVRGWLGSADQALAQPPPGLVAVTGRVERGSPLGTGPVQAGLRDGYLVRTAQSPPDPLSLQPVPASPPPSDAPAQFHLQNAIYVSQWLLLAVIIAVSWWRLRRAGRDGEPEGDGRPLEPAL